MDEVHYNHESMIEAIKGFLSLLADSSSGVESPKQSLAQSLNRLVTEYFSSHEVEVSDSDVEAPTANYDSLRKMAEKSFPEFGFYPSADPLGEINQEMGMGDAIDDLADIARDLTEVLWYFENERINDAVWQFRWGYANHWGDHLHDLMGYLHKLIFWR